MRTRISNQVKRGFTLIEILIVVVILGILAAIVIPQFSEASDDAKQNAAKSTLQTVRAQIELFKFKTNTAAADIDDFTGLVPDYLQAAPTADGYTFTVTDGIVAVADADGNATGW